MVVCMAILMVLVLDVYVRTGREIYVVWLLRASRSCGYICGEHNLAERSPIVLGFGVQKCSLLLRLTFGG